MEKVDVETANDFDEQPVDVLQSFIVGFQGFDELG